MADREEGMNPDDAVPEEPHRAVDEEEAWAKLVAAYDEEPGPGAEPWPEAESLPAPPSGEDDVEDADTDADADADANTDTDADTDTDTDTDTDAKNDDGGGDGDAEPSAPAPPPETTRVVIHPVIQGPRDYQLAEDDDEGHFEPPEPPPLPETDVTTKFAWLAVLGGPLLIFAFILLQQELPWWAITVGIGGFLGGFATLVARMRPGDGEDDDLTGGGAVV